MFIPRISIIPINIHFSSKYFRIIIYQSINVACSQGGGNYCPLEFLNNSAASELPILKINLKVGIPISLFHNLNLQKLCNSILDYELLLCKINVIKAATLTRSCKDNLCLFQKYLFFQKIIHFSLSDVMIISYTSINVLCSQADGDDYSLKFLNNISTTELPVHKKDLRVGRSITLVHSLNLQKCCNSIRIRFGYFVIKQRE